jgi:putative addiction module killer protein
VEARPRELQNYVTANGREPFDEWLNGLDKKTSAIVDARLIRVSKGLLGDCKSVGSGIRELRIHEGGYRVYFGEEGDKIVLLIGGRKNTQDRDIAIAKIYWKDDQQRRG